MDDKNKIKIVFESIGLDNIIAKLGDFSKKLNDSNKNINSTASTSKSLDDELKKSSDSFNNIADKIKLSSSNMVTFKTNADIMKSSKNDFESLSSSIDNQRESFIALKNSIDNNSYDTGGLENILSLNDELISKSSESASTFVSINEQATRSVEAAYSNMQNMIIANQISFVDEIKNIDNAVGDNYDKMTSDITTSHNRVNSEILEASKENISVLNKTANDSNLIVKDTTSKTSKEITNSAKTMDSEFDNSIKNMNTNFNSFFNSVKQRKAELEAINKTMTSLSSITSSVGNISKMVFQSKLEDLSAYDIAIEELKNKEIENIQTVASIEKETRDIENEEYIARLESEYERSIEASDLLSANAIANKLKELDADKEKKEIEKELNNKKKEEERINTEKQKEAEKKKNYEIAMAEYNKSMAMYNNNVKIAEMEKNHAIASGSVIMAQGVAEASLGVAKSVSQLGPIAGLALGLSTAATLLGSITSGVSAIKGASGNLESVKSAVPTTPKFRYGTEGFALKVGESAIVGEESEVIKNKAGELQVMSVEKTKSAFADTGITINNLNLFVEDITSTDDIITILKELKERGMNYAV